MTHVRVGLLWALLALAGPAYAQPPQEGWHLSVDVLFVTTRGNDVHVGDVFTESLRNSGTSTDSIFNYGVTYDPIVTPVDDDASVLIAGGYRGARWGFGVRGWGVVPGAAVAGRASTRPATASSSFVTGVRMWDHSLAPVTNMREPSGVSPVGYEATNTLEHVRIDGYVEWRWIAAADLNVAAQVGLVHARTANTRREGQTLVAFLETLSGAGLSTLENHITIDSQSEAQVPLTGPLFAVSGDTRFGRLRVDWRAGQAVLFGTAETEGTWTDIDNIREVLMTGSTTVTTTELLRGVIPMKKDERAFVPVLDLQVKASVEVTRAIRVGVGLFSSTWFRLPVAPAFSVPGDWTDLQGTAWREQHRDISFNAISVFLGFGL